MILSVMPGARRRGVRLAFLTLALSSTHGAAMAQDTPREVQTAPPQLADPPAELRAPSAPDCRLTVAGTGPFRGVAFTGNTVFDNQRLLAHLGLSDAGAALSLEDAECVRLAITRFYIDAGYINSGAVVDGPLVAGAPVTLRIVEGRLTDVVVRGADGTAASLRLNADYVRDRLIGPDDVPLNRADLQRRFRALLEDANIERLQGTVVPGAVLGEAVLEVLVSEPDAVTAAVGVNNFDPPSTGVHVAEAALGLRNLTGRGEAVLLEVDISRGKQQFGADIEVPISAYGLLVTAGVDHARTRVVEEPFDVLEIKGRFLRASAGVEWTPYDTGADKLTFGLRGDYQRNRTELLGEPFSFSPGARAGQSRAAVLRFFQEYISRDAEQAFSARSTFSFGLPVGGVTKNAGDVPDGQFTSWLGELFYVRNVPFDLIKRDLELSVRGISQFAFDPLLSFEQVALTGADVVRGFREDAIVADNLLLLDLGVRTGLFDVDVPDPREDGALHRSTVYGKAFLTAGTGWMHDGFGARASAMGAGMTLDFEPLPGLALTLGFAAPVLSSDAVRDADARDTRVYFSSAFRF